MNCCVIMFLAQVMQSGGQGILANNIEKVTNQQIYCKSIVDFYCCSRY